MPPTLVDVLESKVGVSGARVMTFRVLLLDTEAAAIMRATACTADALPTVLRDEILGTVSALIDKGLHGMQGDEMIAAGSIEVGRPSAL